MHQVLTVSKAEGLPKQEGQMGPRDCLMAGEVSHFKYVSEWRIKGRT